MLFAVSIETTQPWLRGWARRARRVFVDAADKDQARRRVQQRYRGQPELRCVVREVAPVTLPEEPPAAALARARAKPKRGRKKKRPARKRAASPDRNPTDTRGNP